MHSRKRFPLGRARTERSLTGRGPGGQTVLLPLLIALAFACGVGVDRFVLGSAQGATAGTLLTELPEFAVLEQTYDAIREHYVESDEVSNQALIYGASQGMVEALGDEGHSSFLTPEEAAVSEASLRGELTGIGIYVDSSGPMPVVIAPIDSSPAFAAGIRAGDVIVAVDGVLTADLDEAEWTRRIRGEAGTDVRLTMRRQGEEQTYEVTITRAKIRIDPVSWRMLPGDIAWVKLSEFSQGATQEVVDALGEARGAGAQGVILDLRNNPGGYVHEAVGVGSQFLPEGTTLFQQQNREGEIAHVRTLGRDGGWQAGPLVVLINEGSASAAEIVSSALRDNERATLIGETTFGTGTVLLPFELSDGSVVHLGTELWLTADGEEIWKRGVEPDREVLLEDGAYPELPINFAAGDVPREEFVAIDDAQLRAGHRAVAATT